MNINNDFYISPWEKYGMATMIPCSFSETSEAVMPQLLFDSCNIYNSSGKGIKIGIVSAFAYDELQKDLDIFCTKTQIEKKKINIISAPSFAFAPSRIICLWKNETALDVQWVNSFAPQADIYCFLSRSDDINDIFPMIEKADSECDIVLLSFGTLENAMQSEYEKFFMRSKALFVCASGNSNNIYYPASSAYTLAAGGTEIYFDTKGRKIGNEHYKKGSCGVSKYTAMPYHQIDYKRFGTNRLVPDITFFSGGNRGAYFYCDANGKDLCAKGTSVSAACIAGICANIAEYDRSILTKKASYFYELAKEKTYNELFTDIVMGRNDRFKALKGFDICTGLGTPKLNKILQFLHTLS